MQSRLIEVVPDVLSAPGKLSMVSPKEAPDPNVYDQFAEALADFADVQAQRLGGHRQDTQWNTSGRNYLAKVDSPETAMETVTQLSAMRKELLEAMTAAFVEVLLAAGWAHEDAKIYCKSGGLAILVTRTLDDYCALLLFLVYKVLNHPENWDRVSQVYANFHSRKLGMIRRLARRREYLLYRNYTYLRDARALNFQDLSIVTKIMEQNLDEVLAPENDKDKKPKKWDCTYCHEKFHTGGSAKCDLVDLSTNRARSLAKIIDKRLAEGETDKAKVVAEVIKESG
jgi:hypothetical protein